MEQQQRQHIEQIRQVHNLEELFNRDRGVAVALDTVCRHILEHGHCEVLYFVKMFPRHPINFLLSIQKVYYGGIKGYSFIVLAKQKLTGNGRHDQEQWSNKGSPTVYISEEPHGFNTTTMPSSFFRYMANTRPETPWTGFPYESSAIHLCCFLPVVKLDQDTFTASIEVDVRNRWILPLRDFTDRYIYE